MSAQQRLTLGALRKEFQSRNWHRKATGAVVRELVVHSFATGAYRTTLLQREFAEDPSTLVALELNGEVLHVDHGYPARLISPARPGVLQTKWLSALEVR